MGAGLLNNQKVSSHIQFKWHRPKLPIRSCRPAIGGDVDGELSGTRRGPEAPFSASSHQKQMAMPPVDFHSTSPPEPHTVWCLGKLGALLQELINDKEEGKHLEQLEQSREVKM